MEKNFLSSLSDSLLFVGYEVTYWIHYRVGYSCVVWKVGERAWAGDYIDCVASWQRQWHMSPRLLVIADLNMRQSRPLWSCFCCTSNFEFLLTTHFSSVVIVITLITVFPTTDVCPQVSGWSLYIASSVNIRFCTKRVELDILFIMSWLSAGIIRTWIKHSQNITVYNRVVLANNKLPLSSYMTNSLLFNKF